MRHGQKGLTAAAGIVVAALMAADAAAQQAQPRSDRARLEALEKVLEDLIGREQEKDKLIRELQAEIRDLKAGHRGRVPAPAERAQAERGGHAHAPGHAHEDETPDLYSVDIGDDATLRFKGIAVNTALAAGTSTARNGDLENLQGGHHDPRQRGFTLQSVDITFAGALDPYFDAQATVAINIDPEGETVTELEEAFLRSKSLPWGLELKLGQFFTEFGLTNTRHVHDQAFIDQPLVATRFFGEDGLRGQGYRLGWTLPVPWQSALLFGMQNAKGETQASFLSSDEAFEERPIGGRAFRARDVRAFEDFTYLLRFANRFPAGDGALRLGLSGLYGPNATGSDADTYIYGADLGFHQPLSEGRFWSFEGEVIGRRYRAAADEENGFAADTLKDWGVYAQGIYRFHPKWSAGLRYEYATGSGESVGIFDGRSQDPFRDDRHRVSPLLTWHFAPTASVRLQYNYDRADHLEDEDAHTVWLGFQWGFGAGSALELHGGYPHEH
jgi:hypothetical protein